MFAGIPGRPRRGVRLSVAAGVFLALIVFGGDTVRAQGYRDTALSLVGQLVRFFPPAEGYVVSLPGDEVYIDLSDTDLLRPGMELLVFREGRDIVHPVTGEVLGRYEERVGYLTITEVQEKYSVGKAVPGGGEVRAGDRVRISSRPLRALLFFAAESEVVETARLARELVDAAAESGRFRLQDEPEWLPRATEAGHSTEGITGNPAALAELGRSLKADLLLVVTPEDGESPTVNLQVLSLWTGRSLAAYREAWTPPPPAMAPAAEGRGGFGRFFGGRGEAESTREYTTKSMPGEVRSITVGEMTGTGGVDILVSNGESMTLYSWESGGLIWQWEGGSDKGRRILNLESGDLDGDGRAEALVTAVKYGRLTTDVLAWSGGEWNRLSREEAMYLRLFPVAGRTVILGQRAGRGEVFSGPVREYAWLEGSFTPVEGRTLARGVNIFGLGLADLTNDGEAEYLSLDGEGKLRVYDGEGEVISYGDERYGGYPPLLKVRDLFPRSLEADVTLGSDLGDDIADGAEKGVESDIRTAFQGRVLVGGLGRVPATPFIAVPNNLGTIGKVMPNLRQFEKGAVSLLAWQDGRLVDAGGSNPQEGYVADAALWDLNGDGIEEVFMAVNAPQGGLLKKRGSLVLWRHQVSGMQETR